MSSVPDFGFAVPAGYDWIVSHGLVGFTEFSALEPWYLLGAADIYSVQERWPKSRDPLLVAFARRQDNDDVACFELDAAKRTVLGVRLIHADTAAGYDVLDWFGSFWDWFASAIRDVRESAEASEQR